MKRLGFIAAIIVIGAAAAGISWWRYPFAKAASKASAEPSLDADVLRLKQEVAALRDRPATQRTVLQYVPTQAAPIESAAAPAPAPETDEQKMARLEQRAQAVAESFDRRLLTEPRDVAWGNEAVTQATESLAKVPGATVLSSTCASTVCRVELSQQSNDEQRALGSSISNSPPFDQGTLYRYDYDSVPPKTTLYVIRRGHDLTELAGADLAALD
jgi:hypothetical protein